MSEPTLAARSHRSRRMLLALLALALVVVVAVHALGGATVIVIAACLAAVALLVLVLWRLPHLRRHFASPYGKARVRARAYGRAARMRYARHRPGTGYRRPRGSSRRCAAQCAAAR